MVKFSVFCQIIDVPVKVALFTCLPNINVPDIFVAATFTGFLKNP